MRLVRMPTFIVLFIAAVVSVVAVPGLAAQRPDSVARADTAVRAKPVVVTATRSERRVEDTPVRVEVVDEEEVAEKVAMTPGDVTMLLNETPGLRIQITSAALGGAGVRVQGLQSRYTMILSDGLPLLGAQSSGLGLLQLPPVDLAGAEVIKGISSALYGGAAMGGVINFLSRRPGDSPSHDFVANQTSRNGTDLVYFGARPFNDRWGATLLTSVHRQERSDIDRDGWIDLPRYARAVVRPRVFFDDRAGRTLLATAGMTIEERAGGTMPGALTPAGTQFAEGLGTARADAGLSARRLTARGDLLALRAAAVTQRHRHRIGTELERDTHDALFAEATATMPRGANTFVTGLAWTSERYANRAVPVHDYSHRAPAAFVQMDRDVAPWLVVSSALRADAHNVYGTALSPRVSVLARRTGGALAGWNVRLSGGQGSFAPTPHTEETEATGLLAVVPLSGLEAERATGGSADLSGVIGLGEERHLDVNVSMFTSRVEHSVRSVDAGLARPLPPSMLRLVNAPLPSRTTGIESYLRLVAGDARITASYAYTDATEWAEGSSPARRVESPLIPRHSAGLVMALEREGQGRAGLEMYYVGRQALDDNPYRTDSRSHLVIGVLIERVIGGARVFVNAENLLDERQTRYERLVLPARGRGGRWTTDAWSLLDGRTFNAGFRIDR